MCGKCVNQAYLQNSLHRLRIREDATQPAPQHAACISALLRGELHVEVTSDGKHNRRRERFGKPI